MARRVLFLSSASKATDRKSVEATAVETIPAITSLRVSVNFFDSLLTIYSSFIAGIRDTISNASQQFPGLNMLMPLTSFFIQMTHSNTVHVNSGNSNVEVYHSKIL